MKARTLVLTFSLAALFALPVAAEPHNCETHCAMHTDKDAKMCTDHCGANPAASDHNCATHCATQSGEADKACAVHCAK